MTAPRVSTLIARKSGITELVAMVGERLDELELAPVLCDREAVEAIEVRSVGAGSRQQKITQQWLRRRPRFRKGDRMALTTLAEKLFLKMRACAEFLARTKICIAGSDRIHVHCVETTLLSPPKPVLPPPLALLEQTALT